MRRFARDPVVCALGAGADDVVGIDWASAVEDEQCPDALALCPGSNELDQAQLGDVRPPGAEDVSRVDDDGEHALTTRQRSVNRSRAITGAVGRIERPLPRAATLLAAGLVGGAIALGGAAALGRLDGTSTVREVIGAGSFRTPAAFESRDGLSVGEIYRRASPGVVQIEAERTLGSGWVFDKVGHVVTNYHVVRGADEIVVSFSNNERVRARLVGVDPSTDLALLKVSTPARGLTPLLLGDSSDVGVGDAVVAIGNPFGYERSATAGIVSAIGRVRQAAVDDAIQTDAPMNPRNSGGPLLNARGEVIGVNTIDPGNVGVGLAIPIDMVKSVAAQILRSGKAEHAFLGVQATPITSDVARLFGLPKRGLLVAAVVPASGADLAGMRPGRRQVIVEGESWRLGGDVIVRADGRQVATIEALRAVVARKRPGDTVELEIIRGGAKLNVRVKLGRAPAAPTQ